jgi:hypothetical protein
MDSWTARMRRKARGRIATALQLGATAPRSTGVTKGKVRRVTKATSPRRQRGPQLAEAAWEHGRWRVGLGRVRDERKEWVGWLVAGPRKGKVFPISSNSIY